MEENKDSFTHVAVKKELQTKRKISILSQVLHRKQFALVDMWANDAWELAKKAGMVTDAMLGPEAHWVGEDDEKPTKKGKK